ncbi:DUF4881 domain-containing protein [Desulfovibrio sp. OttesenSCG-928-A18]|nr:DUF4881 domain-containing protein [Desulfovibrio sp. OttesenSCG-928-A18]
MVRKILPMLLVLIGLGLVGCGNYGEVEQGRVVKWDPEAKPPKVWIVPDSNTIEGKPPVYDKVPADVFELPTDTAERGADPFAALRVNLDVERKIITMYNLESGALEKLPFEVVKDDTGVSVRRKHPLVYDTTTGKEREFPVIDDAEKTITIYSRRQERLTTIKLSDTDFAKYEGKEWDAGDEVRVYYKEKGKSLRFMNVTKTDFSRRK